MKLVTPEALDLSEDLSEDKTQESINCYIKQVRLKIECLSYGIHNVDWSKLKISREEALHQMADLDRQLVAAIRLLPE